MHLFKSDLSETYFRFDAEVSSFLHSTWLYVKVRLAFWYNISSTLTTVTGVTISTDPQLCLLGNFANIKRSMQELNS